MKLFKLVFVFAAFSLFALACNNTNTNTANTGTQPSPVASPAATVTPTPDEFAETREYYADNCAVCHKENGEGGSVKLDEKRINVPSFKKGHALTHTDEEFAKQIANGGDGMPAFKEKMTTDEINKMVRFVRKEFQSGLAPAPASGKPLASEPPKH